LGLEYKQAYELPLKDISLLKSFGGKEKEKEMSYILKFLYQNPYIHIYIYTHTHTHTHTFIHT